MTTNIFFTDPNSTISSSIRYGVRVYIKNNCKIISVRKQSNSASTYCIIRDDSNKELTHAPFSGDYASFDFPVNAGTYYRILCLKDYPIPHTRIASRKISPGYPVNSNDLNFTEQLTDTTVNTFWFYEIYSIDTIPTDPTGLTLSPTYLYINQTLTATGSGSSGYRYRFDNYTDNVILQDYSDTNTYVPSSSLKGKTIRVYTKGWNGSSYSTNAYTADILVRLPKQKIIFGTADKSIVVGP